jgi:threonine synthase
VTAVRLRCFACDCEHDPGVLQTVCRRCGLPLRVDVDLPATLTPEASVASLWRYAAVLPPVEPVTLVEGWTPLLPVGDATWVKDESRNPTGSFKARGMTLAVSLARALGARGLQAPSAGNAAGALAAYGARAGLPVVVAMPRDTPRPFVDECRHYGAEVHLVEGTIADAGKFLAARGRGDDGWFDVSTLKEPYRVEGKKTMAYELREQLGALPDVIVYPTGGGTGLVGMWKAFGEMARLGWARPPFPRLVAVQAEGCAPVVKGFRDGAERTEAWAGAATRAYGLRVPSPIAGFVCLRALRETDGTAVAVPEADIEPAARALAARTGIDVCPEGGAAWAGTEMLRRQGWIRHGERVVIFNTGTGLKYR